MLVISRQREEWIQIGPDVRITVVDIRDTGKVRLGIECPEETVIARDEVLARIKLDHGPGCTTEAALKILAAFEPQQKREVVHA